MLYAKPAAMHTQMSTATDTQTAMMMVVFDLAATLFEASSLDCESLSCESAGGSLVGAVPVLPAVGAVTPPALSVGAGPGLVPNSG